MTGRSRRRRLRIAAMAAAVVWLGIQLVPVSRTNPSVIADVAAPPAVATLLRRACYDCHSHETVWPWYSRVAPASWLLAQHVRRGRGDLNFSAWPALDFTAQDHLRREIVEVLRDGEMPPRSYLWGHPAARLSADEVAALTAWARGG